MTESSDNIKNLKKYLILLAVGRGMVFWYAIEKLFELHIGLSIPKIVLISALAQGSKVIFELPTSVVADRWSRRNILIFADGAMILCSLILGIATSFNIYLIGLIFWALSDALSSGVYEAFAYDSAVSQGAKPQFRKIYSRMRVMEWGTMAVAGLIAGVISQFVGFRASYFLTIIPMIFSIYLLVYKFVEPPMLRTSDQGIGWLMHLVGAIDIMRQKQVRWVVAIFVALFGSLTVWFEYYQLVGIDVHISKIVFGSLTAAVTGGLALAAALTHRWAGSKRTLGIVWVGIIVAHIAGLRSSVAVIALANIFITFVALQMLMIYLELYLHDHISSERRATIFSLAGTLAYAWFFILAAVFTYAFKHTGIRWALTITSAPLLILGILDLVRGVPWAINRKADIIEALKN